MRLCFVLAAAGSLIIIMMTITTITMILITIIRGHCCLQVCFGQELVRIPDIAVLLGKCGRHKMLKQHVTLVLLFR